MSRAVPIGSPGGSPRVGVLALQGAVRPHLAALASLGATPVEVRTPDQLASVDALVLPGGESTTMSKLLDTSGLRAPLADRLASGLPALGTCAGMILLARDVLDGRPDQRSFGSRAAGRGDPEAQCQTLRGPAEETDGPTRPGRVEPFGAIDIAVRRNAFGRQVDSFEADLRLPEDPDPLHAVFIRAPVIEEAGERVEVLAAVDGRPVLARQGPVIVASFHPELTDDLRLHRLLLAETGHGTPPTEPAGSVTRRDDTEN